MIFENRANIASRTQSSNTSLVKRRLIAAAIEGLERRTLMAANDNLLTNGDFEQEPAYDAPTSLGYQALTGSQIPGWTLTGGHAATVHDTSLYPTIGGKYSINTDGEGADVDMYQDFNAQAGAEYKLSYDWYGWLSASFNQIITLTDTVTQQVLYNGSFAWAQGTHHETATITGAGNPVRLEVLENPFSGYNDNGFVVDNFVVTGDETGLTIKTQPRDVSPGDVIKPAPRVQELDSNGKPDKSVHPITVTLDAGSVGEGVLTGITTKNTAGSFASFSNLKISKPGSYILDFSDDDGNLVSSRAFNVSPAKLVFKGNIGRVVPGQAFKPVTIELENQRGKKITNVTSSVTLSVTGDTGTVPITGNVGTLTKGSVVFKTLKISKPGDYTLTASDDQGDADGTSNLFTVTKLHLAFKMEPATVGVNAPLRYKIAVEDYRNRLINTSSLGLGLGLNVVDGGMDATVSPLADTVDFGLAVNSGSTPSKINAAGTYTITFRPISESVDDFDNTIDPITSNQFKVVANHLVFTHQPGTALPNSALHYQIAMKDYRNKTVDTNNDTLTFTLIPSNGATGQLILSTDHLSGGIAANSGNQLSITSGGTYSLVVVDVPVDPTVPAAASVTSSVFTVKSPK